MLLSTCLFFMVGNIFHSTTNKTSKESFAIFLVVFGFSPVNPSKWRKTNRHKKFKTFKVLLKIKSTQQQVLWHIALKNFDLLFHDPLNTCKVRTRGYLNSNDTFSSSFHQHFPKHIIMFVCKIACSYLFIKIYINS